MGQLFSRRPEALNFEPYHHYNPYNPRNDSRLYGLDTLSHLQGLELRNSTREELIYMGKYLHKGIMNPTLQPQDLDPFGDRFMAFYGHPCRLRCDTTAGLVVWRLKSSGRYVIFLWEQPWFRLFGAKNIFCMGVTVFRPKIDKELYYRMRNGRQTFFRRCKAMYPNSVFDGNLIRHRLRIQGEMGSGRRVLTKIVIRPFVEKGERVSAEQREPARTQIVIHVRATASAEDAADEHDTVYSLLVKSSRDQHWRWLKPKVSSIKSIVDDSRVIQNPEDIVTREQRHRLFLITALDLKPRDINHITENVTLAHTMYGRQLNHSKEWTLELLEAFGSTDGMEVMGETNLMRYEKMSGKRMVRILKAMEKKNLGEIQD